MEPKKQKNPTRRNRRRVIDLLNSKNARIVLWEEKITLYTRTKFKGADNTAGILEFLEKSKMNFTKETYQQRGCPEEMSIQLEQSFASIDEFIEFASKKPV
jgi:hypothetical protein